MRPVRLLCKVDLNIQLNPLTEHVTAVTVSVKDKLNLSLSVAAGSSLVNRFMISAMYVLNLFSWQQIALFVIP
jgi:Ca2+:H+ antiporter